MTEAEWLAAADTTRLAAFIEPRTTDRKRRLFGVACCRLFQPLGFLGTPPYADALATAERYADRGATARELRAARAAVAALHPRQSEPTPNGYAAWTLHRTMATANHVALSWVCEGYKNVLTSLASGGREWTDLIHDAMAAAAEDARRTLAALAGCIFGNPFRPVAFDPSWRTEAVVALARGVYADRAFGRLPVLADALEDAGCNSQDALAHCRGDGPHARGCWVVDAVLGAG